MKFEIGVTSTTLDLASVIFRRREVYPILSRIQNIGYEKGENNRTPEWYLANHRTPWVARQVATAEEWALS